MKATIGIYENHNDAVTALKQLRNEGFSFDQVSIVGHDGAESMNEKMEISPRGEITYQVVAACVALGAVAGVLNGLGYIKIPGLMSLHEEGGLIGGLAGGDIGLLAGIILTVVLNYFLRSKVAKKYENHLRAGKYLLTAKGSGIEIAVAEGILHRNDTNILQEA